MDQLRANRAHSDMIFQTYIQRVEHKEEEMRRRGSSSESSYGSEKRRRHDHDGGRMHNTLPTRQPPPIKVPKFKREHDPNVYLE